jgi:CubicO group peptidase (beta-lactamase class C family)
MKHTFIKTDKKALKEGVKGYIRNDSLKSYELPDTLNSLFGSPTFRIIGGGGIFSTVADLYKWDQALFTNKLVPTSIIMEAFTPYKFNSGTLGKYGFGWNIYHRNNGDTVVRHAGQFTGYLSIITRNITRRETILLLTNVTGNEDVSTLIALMTQIENILERKN